MSRLIETTLRRKVATGILSASIAMGGASFPEVVVAQSETQLPSPSTEVPQEKPDFITLGTEHNLSLIDQKLLWTPDGHMPYITFSNGTRRYFISSKVSTFAIDTDDQSLKSAIENNLVNPEKIQEVYSPEQNPGYNYTGITAVFSLDQENEKHLTALLHQEEWKTPTDGSGFRASVASAESFDGGLSWINKQVIIKGDDIANPGERVSGAGQPDAIQIGDYLYIYHIDWSAQKTEQHPDQIYLARARVNNGTIEPSLEFYTNQGFIAGQTTDLKPVIPVPSNIDNAGYSALPSVSFNKDLGKYLCIFETNAGFAQTTSADGINWDEPKLIAAFPQTQAARTTMDTWYSYPTLVSDNLEDNDHTTRSTGTLYYSKGIWNASPHNLVARDYSLK